MSKPLNITCADKQNDMWSFFNEENTLTVPLFDHLKQDSKVFAMGSCFAVEIRTALTRARLDVYPKYKEIPIDHSRYIIGHLPKRDNINYYHTFAIRQEFERHLGLWQQAENDYWEVKDYWWKQQDIIYQDPYRRTVLGKTPEELFVAIDLVTEATRVGMESADIFLLTLGLIEVWKKKDDGRYSCEFPGYNLGGGFDETVFHLSTFLENYDNVKTTVKLIREINPKAKIILTVSPVALGRTFTQNDVVIANTESKSLLRSVAGQVCREEDDVFYFPSYEIANAFGKATYTESGRHVKDNMIFAITNVFMKSHSQGAIGT